MRLFLQVYEYKIFERTMASVSRPLAGETAMRAGMTRRASTLQETWPGKASNRNLITAQETERLRDHLESCLVDLVEGGQDLGVRLVSLLRHDHVCEFGGETYVRFFD